MVSPPLKCIMCTMYVTDVLQLSLSSLAYSTTICMFLMHVCFSFCLKTLCVTLRSNFLTNRINFIHGHKLLPCFQQRLLRVYRKMFIPTTDGNVVENFILYDIILLFYL